MGIKSNKNQEEKSSYENGLWFCEGVRDKEEERIGGGAPIGAGGRPIGGGGSYG
jgi:hypothetical protein